MISTSEVPQFIERLREQYWALGPDAIAAVRYALKVKKDARLAIAVLRDLDIGQRAVTQPDPTPNVTPEEAAAQRKVQVITNYLKRRMGIA